MKIIFHIHHCLFDPHPTAVKQTYLSVTITSGYFQIRLSMIPRVHHYNWDHSPGTRRPSRYYAGHMLQQYLIDFFQGQSVIGLSTFGISSRIRHYPKSQWHVWPLILMCGRLDTARLTFLVRLWSPCRVQGNYPLFQYLKVLMHHPIHTRRKIRLFRSYLAHLSPVLPTPAP